MSFKQRPQFSDEYPIQAVAALLPKYFVEFVKAEDVSDWVQDRPGVDYGPRWVGDVGVRWEEEAKRQEEAARSAIVLPHDAELDKLMPKFGVTGAKVARKRHKSRKPKK